MIKPVQFSEWAAFIAPVFNSDGFPCVSDDYKVMLNQVALPDTYSLHKVDNIHVRTMLTGGETFTKLDLAHAYQLLVLDMDSSSSSPVHAMHVWHLGD